MEPSTARTRGTEKHDACPGRSRADAAVVVAGRRVAAVAVPVTNGVWSLVTGHGHRSRRSPSLPVTASRCLSHR